MVNHRNGFESVREQGIQYVDYIFVFCRYKGHWDAMVGIDYAAKARSEFDCWVDSEIDLSTTN